MPNKNEIVRLEITDVTVEGNGVGRYEDMAVFVPMTAVGDVINCKIVKVKKSYCYGIVESFVSRSPCRIDSDCPVSKQCGGCSFRHISYEEECRIKEKFIRDSFERIGKQSPVF
jgi:23S rRNA (uracil1939-C5)-methyltransferase